MPVEIICVQLAEAWGQHPQDILERKRGVYWSAWSNLYHTELERARKNTAK